MLRLGEIVTLVSLCTAERHQIVMLGSGVGRWAVAALLAAFAFADGAAQYLMSATPLPHLLHISPGALTFLKVSSSFH